MRINLAQTKSMKRYLVYTTDDSRTRPFDPTRFLASATPQNRRFRPPVEKVGLGRSLFSQRSHSLSGMLVWDMDDFIDNASHFRLLRSSVENHLGCGRGHVLKLMNRIGFAQAGLVGQKRR